MCSMFFNMQDFLFGIWNMQGVYVLLGFRFSNSNHSLSSCAIRSCPTCVLLACWHTGARAIKQGNSLWGKAATCTIFTQNFSIFSASIIRLRGGRISSENYSLECNFCIPNLVARTHLQHQRSERERRTIRSSCNNCLWTAGKSRETTLI